MTGGPFGGFSEEQYKATQSSRDLFMVRLSMKAKSHFQSRFKDSRLQSQ